MARHMPICNLQVYRYWHPTSNRLCSYACLLKIIWRMHMHDSSSTDDLFKFHRHWPMQLTFQMYFVCPKCEQLIKANATTTLKSSFGPCMSQHPLQVIDSSLRSTRSAATDRNLVFDILRAHTSVDNACVLLSYCL